MKNPYSAYATGQKATASLSAQETISFAYAKAASLLGECLTVFKSHENFSDAFSNKAFSEQYERAITINRNLWIIFLDDLGTNQSVDLSLKENLMNLGNYSIQTLLKELAAPTESGLNSLININLQLSAGFNENKKS